MKPLTIEELKALKVGEFVYLTNGNKQYGTYAKKVSSSNCENQQGLEQWLKAERSESK